METTKIQPALTAVEWARAAESAIHDDMLSCAGDGVLNGYDDERERRSETECWHAAAALALHGQPFGFTQRDVDAIRIAAENANTPAHYDALHSVADRIKALLPPK